MRLRSSQFVFLLLLLCSVQIGEEYAFQLATGAHSGVIAERPDGAVSAGRIAARISQTGRFVLPARLDSGSLAAHRTPWTMRQPALEAAAMSNHSSLLRA